MCRHPARETRFRGWNLQSLLRTPGNPQTPVPEKAQPSTFGLKDITPIIFAPVLLSASIFVRWPSWTRSPPAWPLSLAPLRLGAHPPTSMGGTFLACPSQPCLSADHTPTWHGAHTRAHPQVRPPLKPAHTQCFTRRLCVCTSLRRVLVRNGPKRIVNQTHVFVQQAVPALSKERAQGQAVTITKPPLASLRRPDNKEALRLFWKISRGWDQGAENE